MKKAAIATSLMALTLVASFAGAISGTIAWYASSTRATAEYQGTSVAQSDSLQIGLMSDTDLTALVDMHGDPLDLGLEKDPNNSKYFWAKEGSGLKANAVNAYLKNAGMATNELMPVTSSVYTAGDELALKRAPIAFSTRYDDPAQTEAYCQIHIILRAWRDDESGERYFSKGERIWITDAVAEAQSGADKDIYKALRVHFKGSAMAGEPGNETFQMVDKWILNPGLIANSPAGYTDVAGPLDLNQDGFYDCKSGEEIVYGQYTKDASYPASLPKLDDDATTVDDVNHTNAEEASTFLAKHQGNAGYYPKGNEGFDAWIHPGHANYESLRSISPTDPGTGSLSEGKPVAITNPDENGDAVAHAIATVYLEGWDHSVIDTAVNSKFNLGLQFQIDRG